MSNPMRDNASEPPTVSCYASAISTRTTSRNTVPSAHHDKGSCLVRNGHSGVSDQCPLFKRNETSIGVSDMAVLCQKQTAPRLNWRNSITSSARARSVGEINGECRPNSRSHVHLIPRRHGDVADARGELGASSPVKRRTKRKSSIHINTRRTGGTRSRHMYRCAGGWATFRHSHITHRRSGGHHGEGSDAQ